MSSLEPFTDAITFAHDPTQDLREPRTADERDLERTAALASAALSHPAPAPESLAAKLAADALQFCASEHPTTSREIAPGFTTPRPRSNGALLSFVLGAAAAGLFVWLATSTPTPQLAPSASELRAATLDADAALRRDWTPGPSPLRGEVRGDVVWRQGEQDGWLTFQDLPALPEDQAYQLWIVDGERDGAPVDGGVFTIDAADQETLVTIRPALPIGKPTAFVVTVEGRQGAVVSKQEHVVAIASL